MTSSQDQQASVRVTVTNELGMHARPAMAFVDLANRFACSVHVRKGEQVVDGKSIMHMMMLAATQGTELTIEADGSDAEAAIASLAELVNRKFDEPR